MQLTTSQLAQVVGCNAATAARWAAPLGDACRLYEIDTVKRMAAFMAEIGHESDGLTALVENLNYREDRLREVCENAQPGTRWRSLLPRVRELARNPVGLGNAAYGGRMGNGPEASGDGYRYRGRGAIGNTGKANYAGMRDTLRAKGIRNVPDFVATPEALQQPTWAAYAAAAFWSERGLNELADAGRFDTITSRINNGQNGRADRRARYFKALAALGA